MLHEQLFIDRFKDVHVTSDEDDNRNRDCGDMHERELFGRCVLAALGVRRRPRPYISTYTPNAFWISAAMAVQVVCILASDSASTITLARASVPE